MECGNCCGEGYVEFDEDGRLARDACYHCGTTGKVDEATAHMDELSVMAGNLAQFKVYNLKKAANEDPDGEGWVFRAAENMMYEYEYTQEMISIYRDLIMNQLTKLDFDTQKLLIDFVNRS